MSPDDESTINGGQRRQQTTRVRRNMQDHQKESKKGHWEMQLRYHTRNDHGIKEREESTKNALGATLDSDSRTSNAL